MQSYTAVYEIVISSPGINRAMVKRTLELVRNRQLNGVNVKVLTLPYETYPESRIEITKELITELKQSGIDVRLKSDLHEHFAVIDRNIVWYGSINLLSKAKEEDSLMRVPSSEIADELLEIGFTR